MYVLILRNGDRVVAKEKYQVKGANAVFVTKMGDLEVAPALAQIDVEATGRVNSQGVGDAQLMEWVDAKSGPFPRPRRHPPFEPRAIQAPHRREGGELLCVRPRRPV